MTISRSPKSAEPPPPPPGGGASRSTFLSRRAAYHDTKQPLKVTGAPWMSVTAYTDALTRSVFDSDFVTCWREGDRYRRLESFSEV